MSEQPSTEQTRSHRKMPLAQSLGGTLAALLVAGVIAAAGTSASADIAGLPAFLLCGVIAFAVQWLVFVHAYRKQTEHFFDLTGSLTYITLALFALSVSGDDRAWLIAVLVLIWAARLGTFLFSRVREAGSDARFDSIKPDFMQFFMTWTLQGLWVFITFAPGLAAMTSVQSKSLGIFALAGTLLWISGFAIEVVADSQKRRFRANPENRDRFIATGLWAWSQHPNYFGEILLWCGIAVIALPVLSGWQYLTLISPLFVYLLLTQISGVRMLDARARRQWGKDAAYQAYRERTPTLLLKPPRSA